MKTPESSQAPDLIRMVSWISVCWEKFLLAIVMAKQKLGLGSQTGNDEHLLCLLSNATREPSALHTEYLTGGVAISARVFCC